MTHTVEHRTTQGPWYTSDSAGFDTHGQVMVIDETLGDTVALTYGDPDRSRALLIAAAPELLYACQLAANMPWDTPERSYARAAAAKALGQ